MLYCHDSSEEASTRTTLARPPATSKNTTQARPRYQENVQTHNATPTFKSCFHVNMETRFKYGSNVVVDRHSNYEIKVRLIVLLGVCL